MGKLFSKIKPGQLILFCMIACFGTVFVIMVWQKTKRDLERPAVQLAQSIVYSLPLDSLEQLQALPSDTSMQTYKTIKAKLYKAIQPNPLILSGYFYTLRNGKLFFMIDSTPEDSPDVSRPGDEYYEAVPIYYKPFEDGKLRITKPATDRWGTWVSILVPVENKNGTLIAVLGMDYDASKWQKKLFFEVLQSSLLVIIALILFVLIIVGQAKNRKYKKALTQNKKAEKKLTESQSRLANLVGNLPGFVYRCANDQNYTMEFISEGCKPITGYSPSDFYESEIAFSELILPEYRRPLQIKGNNKMPGNVSFTEEYPIKTASGEIKWLWERGSGVFDAHNNLLYLEGYIEDVTDEKLSQSRLIQSEENLKRTIEESPFGIRIVSNEGVTVYANPTLLSIFGIEGLEEYNKMPAINWYLPSSKAEHINREERRRKNLPVENQYEVSIQRKDQKIKHLQVFRSEILWNGETNIKIIYLDITDRKNAENELRKLSRAIEQNPVSVVITDKDGKIEYVNPRFTQHTGFNLNEAIGERPSILKSGEMDNVFYSNLWNTIISGKTWQGELINKNKKGEFYWDLKSISPILDKDGNITNFVAVSEDITEKKKKENELIFAKDKAEESDRLKSLFLANISHEIRTPMNGILGFAELLKEPHLTNDNRNEYLEVIESSGHRMLNIINDLIDISKIEAGEMTIRIRPTEIHSLLKEIHVFFLPEASKKNLQLDYHCELASEDCTIETDGTKLNQIMTNLVKNAIKFTRSGSINFGYRTFEQGIEFYVSDTGPGIPEDQKEQIFERFRQSSINLTRNYEGAGLGLAISKAYVQMLGGTIRVESEVGKGSRFIFWLPGSIG